MKFRTILLVLSLSLLTGLVSVRNVTISDDFDLDWSVTIYDNGLNALVELSASDHKITYLPDAAQPLPVYIDEPYVKLTNYQNFFVYTIQRENPRIIEAVIVNLQTNTTTTVPNPPMNENEMFTAYRFGAFDPSMTQIALAYTTRDIMSAGCCYSGGIVTVDLETGHITHNLDMDARFYLATAWVDDWTADGIWFAPRCASCIPDQSYNYHLWNPTTDRVSSTTVFNDYRQAERLDASGEVLYSASHPDFPLGGLTYPVQLNTVTYFSRNTYRPDELGHVVFYDDNYLDFDYPAQWVMNGRAFLVTNHEFQNVVVLRDGRLLSIDYASPEHFFAMTGDGWLTRDYATDTLHHYAVTETNIVRRSLYHASGEIAVANIQLPPIPYELRPFEIDIVPPNVVFCPGALPSRIQPGEWARIIVDQYNHSTIALMVGDVEFGDVDWDQVRDVPSGIRVQVLDGPACTSDGWTYLKVDYQGHIGWMLEVWETHYYLAPSSPPE